MRPLHFARTIPFAQLVAGLEQAMADRMVTSRQGPDGLTLYKYTNHCVFDRGWNDYTMIARGLILDHANQQVVTTPFPKFFNLGEMGITMPDEAFEVYEKLDGSLIILFHHAGRWRAITRGSFESAQGQWAQALLDQADASHLVPGTTYLAEAVYPENRIVIHYDDPALVLLSGYDADGQELTYADMGDLGARIGWRVAMRYSFADADAMVTHAHALPATEEGYVVQFASGLRLKVKGAEYARIHALIARVTPLGIWELVNAGDDLDAVRRMVPEELWYDFDAIRDLIEGHLARVLDAIHAAAEATAHLDNKALGLSLDSVDPLARPFLFSYRNYGDLLDHPKSRLALMKVIRPVANELEGYTPSYKMQHFVSEMSA